MYILHFLVQDTLSTLVTKVTPRSFQMPVHNWESLEHNYFTLQPIKFLVFVAFSSFGTQRYNNIDCLRCCYIAGFYSECLVMYLVWQSRRRVWQSITLRVSIRYIVQKLIIIIVVNSLWQN